VYIKLGGTKDSVRSGDYIFSRENETKFIKWEQHIWYDTEKLSG